MTAHEGWEGAQQGRGGTNEAGGVSSGRPRLLDLFCGPGGAGVGYHRAGFEVVGVDVVDQPDYPFEFHKADALEFLAEHWQEFDAHHGSPPCTEHSTLTKATAGRDDDTGTADLLDRTLDAFALLPGGAWIVENVMGAQMPTDVILCGGMFGLRTYRHRRFAVGPAIPMLAIPDHPMHRVPAARKQRAAAWAAGHNLTVTGDNTVSNHGALRPLFEEALGIDWVNGGNLALAIPPAYTQFLGTQLLESLARAA